MWRTMIPTSCSSSDDNRVSQHKSLIGDNTPTFCSRTKIHKKNRDKVEHLIHEINKFDSTVYSIFKQQFNTWQTTAESATVGV